jgi:hypothetical protein
MVPSYSSLEDIYYSIWLIDHIVKRKIKIFAGSPNSELKARNIDEGKQYDNKITFQYDSSFFMISLLVSLLAIWFSVASRHRCNPAVPCVEIGLCALCEWV